MRYLGMAAALATTACQTVPAAETKTETMVCNEPVLMVVTGTTIDRARMLAYGKAIADSRLYEELGGYYLNSPIPAANLEGEAEPGHTTLIVRFPCLANAKAFWYSETYQNLIRPMRLDPSAGEYIVRVYPEIPIRADLAGKVASPDYLVDFTRENIDQVDSD